MNRTQITAGRDAQNRPRGVAAEELRRHNLATLLERLHLLGPTSRSDLTATMGLNRSTIADLIGELAGLGLVEEGPAQASSGPGRPSPMVRTRPDGATVLAVEFSVDSVAVATVGLGGHVFGQVREPRPRARVSPDETIKQVARLARPLIESLPSDASLTGVGAGVAGVTRRSDGFVHLAPNLGWHSVPVGEMLSAQLGLDQPVLVANEADLGALAEYRRGVGAGVPHLIYLSGEAGIGAGIIHDGKPMLGAAGYAGEAGHTLVNPDGHRCRCGARGCWETEAGEEALARHAGIPETVAGVGVLETVMTRADMGDETALAGIAEVGRWLGLGIGNLINVFNPQLVVLGGLYHPLFPFLEKAVYAGARLAALDAPGDVAEIAASGLGPDAPLMGAAELALSEIIADPARNQRTQAG
ncbi:MAG TPA: ROK family protein [Acidimicrobiia bacterium]|nr:ROK family protein [Acidimicrobiia bacterium]